MKFHRLINTLAASMVFTLVSIHPIETSSIMFDAPSAIVDISEEKIVEKPKTLYGIDVVGADIEYFNLGAGNTLADVLGEREVPSSITAEAAKKAKSVFDVRRMKAGNLCGIVKRSGRSRGESRVSHFVYEIDPVDYVVFELEEPVKVYRESKKVQTRTVAVCGEIESSLWADCARQNLDVSLIANLAEIYAWTVDFHHLQKGDRFKIVYEEKFVKDKPVGPGKILAARFVHDGKAFDAFYFENDGIGQYFDEKGQSMKSAFLKAPIKFARISSRYTHRRFHPILKVYRKHLGIDYAAPAGTPVMTVGNGTILQVGCGSAEGKYIKVRHNSEYTTQYMHLSRVAKSVRPGKKVRQGDVIGYVGSTGLSTGPHLDFRFFKNGKPLDFVKVESPRAQGVEKEQMKAFRRKTELFAKKLDTDEDSVASFQNGE
jgi:murein DD-endopeptidase MepM/ murein hydrolase activator NlpD